MYPIAIICAVYRTKTVKSTIYRNILYPPPSFDFSESWFKNP